MIKLVLFDLGGVVVDMPNQRYYKYLAKISRIAASEVSMRIREDTTPLERGQITMDQFTRDVADDLGIKESKIRWVYYFTTLSHLNKEVAAIVKKLKKNYIIAFLSNIDKERYLYAKSHTLKSLMPIFDYTFASYEMKAVKPGVKIYQKVLDTVGVKAEEVLFIDNDAHNAYAARKAGLKAIHFTSVPELKKDLKRFGITLNNHKHTV